jgi:hypothetical protein
VITPYSKNENKIPGPSICILLEQNKTSKMVPTVSYIGKRIVTACVVAFDRMCSLMVWGCEV